MSMEKDNAAVIDINAEWNKHMTHERNKQSNTTKQLAIWKTVVTPIKGASTTLPVGPTSGPTNKRLTSERQLGEREKSIWGDQGRTSVGRELFSRSPVR